MKQTTIKKAFSFSGIALHSGQEVELTVTPASAGSGIVFQRTDIEGSKPIKAESDNVVSTNYATMLGVDGVTVSTVEHILAAFYGMGVDNALVLLDGPEVPIMDGSASAIVDLIDMAGIQKLDAPKSYIVIKEPIRVSDGNKSIELLPNEALANEDLTISIDYSIDFAHPFLTRQSFSRTVNKDVFRIDLAYARTFGFLSDVEMLRENGLAMGGSLENAIVIGEKGILNKGGLRFPDEFVRHKALDLMGDIAILGMPIAGRFRAERSGHAMNFKLIQELLKSPSKWDILTIADRDEYRGYNTSVSELRATA